MVFCLNDFSYQYRCQFRYNHNTASNECAKQILGKYGVSKEDIENKNVEEYKRAVNRIRNWSASSTLERFLPNCPVKVISCDEDGKYSIGLFHKDEAKFTAEGNSIAEAKQNLALAVFTDRNRFYGMYTKWLRANKKLPVSFDKPEKKTYSDAHFAVINFYKQNAIGMKRKSIWKNQLVKLPKENDEAEDEFQAALYIRHSCETKQDAAKECIRSIKHICTQKEFNRRHQNRQQGGWGNTRGGFNNRGGRGGTNGWGQNRGFNQGMQGMMDPQQYQMYYQQQMMMQNMGGNFSGGMNFNQGGNWSQNFNAGWGNQGSRGGFRGRGRGRGGFKRGGGDFNSMMNKAKQAKFN